MSRLALGTAQFGLSYGVSNLSGQIPLAEAQKIVGLARESKIDTIDTAAAYGSSEEVLGRVGVSGFRLITKMQFLPGNPINVNSSVRSVLLSSLRRLRLSRLYGLLVHNPADMGGLDSQIFMDALFELRDEGTVEKIGFSVYDPSELKRLLERWSPDLVQLPLNLLDRRFEKTGLLRDLHSMGVEIHARSVFLQGLLLVPREGLPKKFGRWESTWREIERFRRKASLSRIALCLSYPLSLKEVDRVVVGVDSLPHLEMVIRECPQTGPTPDLPSLELEDLLLINPSKWEAL